jgi:salicylate hydroxylase
MASERKLRIAIIGGGLAGSTLMNALLQHEHLSPEIFESAPEFSERGAAVGLGQNGQAALEEIGPEIAGSLDRAGAVVMTSSRIKVVSCNTISDSAQVRVVKGLDCSRRHALWQRGPC